MPRKKDVAEKERGECQSVFDLGKSWIGGDVGTEASKEELEHR